MNSLFKIFLSFFLIDCCVISFDLESDWSDFKLRFNKKYANREEELRRKSVWLSNLHLVKNHNRKADAGQETFRCKMNEFGDLTRREFVRLKTGYRRNSNFSSLSFNQLRANSLNLNRTQIKLKQAKSLHSPKEINWMRIVSPVKDQGFCGSCWAFSATGAIEAAFTKRTGQRVLVSEQQLIDCSTTWGNEGCDGGLPILAFVYAMENDAITTQQAYSYEERNGACRYDEFKQKAIRVTGILRGKTGDERELQRLVARIGPTTVPMDASRKSFQFYSSGIYSDPTCGNRLDDLNHAVLAVGYSESGGYWLLKNSWVSYETNSFWVPLNTTKKGTSWGMNGFFKMALGRNQCGVALDSVVPFVASA